MIKINLIPPEVLADQEKKLRILQGSALAGVIAVVVACVSLARWTTEHNLTVHREEVRAELNKVNEKVKQVDEFEKVLAAVQSRLDVINNLLKGRLLNPYFMEDFGRSLVSGIWVTNIAAQNQGQGLKLAVSAMALEKDQIANWLRTLDTYGNTVDSATTAPPAPLKPGQKAPKPPPNRFSEIELGAINQQNQAGKQIYSFTVTMTYQNPKL
jgi:Tfp pilus assembly protein PilN